MVAEIRDTNPSGTVQITDTNWNFNGTLFVTVRELEGTREPTENTFRAARRLARRAIHHPHKTRSSRLIRTWFAGGTAHWTFAVSRIG